MATEKTENTESNYSTFSKIIGGLVVAFIMATVGYVAKTAAHAPVVEATFQVEIKHLNENMGKLTKVVHETNTMITKINENHVEYEKDFDKRIDKNKWRIENLENVVYKNHKSKEAQMTTWKKD